ncbi:hypothetical protein [Bifidobacterium psychraerophilum]|uniref:hypothetical protein n=1 Tax=Bifidobacterium psychraerophilum TaxID=218140 RepID=UPI0039E8550A
MWGVMASVYGDVHRSRVDLDAMERHAGALNRTALRLGALADTYAAALIQIEALSRSVPFCRDFSMGTHSLNGHSSFDHRHLIHVCIAQQRSAKALPAVVPFWPACSGGRVRCIRMPNPRRWRSSTVPCAAQWR